MPVVSHKVRVSLKELKIKSTRSCIVVAITCEEQTWWGNTKSPTKKEKHSATAARVWCVWGSNSHFSPLLSGIRNHCAFHSTTTLGYIWKLWKCFWHILLQQINSESLLVCKAAFSLPCASLLYLYVCYESYVGKKALGLFVPGLTTVCTLPSDALCLCYMPLKPVQVWLLQDSKNANKPVLRMHSPAQFLKLIPAFYF